MVFCPVWKPVLVREYERIRKGRQERIRSHRRRKRSPKVRLKAAKT